MDKRIVRNERRHMGSLSRFSAEKFAPGRSVEEQIGNGNGGPARQGRIIHMQDPAARNFDLCPSGLIACRGFQRHAGHGSNRRQRLSAKAKGGNREQIVGGAQLGSGVAFEGEQRVIAIHSVAVVGNANQLPSARLNLDSNAAGASVEGVLQQLLHHRGRPVHNLARGDLVGNLVGKYADAAHKDSG